MDMSIEQFCIHRVVTIHPSDTVATAATRMAMENVGALVVVDDRKPIGIVTDRDLVLRVLAKDRLATETEVRTVMTPNPVCINTDASLEGAISRMRGHRFRRLVVVNDQQEVVGIVTLDDIIELVAEAQQALEGITDMMRAVRHESL
jgi:CBS domain-containing protein